MSEYYWTTRDGRKINLNDMTESHLRNTLKLLIRKNRILPPDDGLCDATEVDIY